MRHGVTFSSLLHLVVLLLVYFGVPSLFSTDNGIAPPIPVTLYQVRDETVPPPPQAPEAEVEAESEPEPAPEKEPLPMPPAPEVSADAPPPPEPTTAKPEPAPRVAEAVAQPLPPTIPEPSLVLPPPPPKPVDLAKPKPAPEPVVAEKPAPPDPLASLLKSVMESAQNAIKLERKQAETQPAEPPPETSTVSRVSDEPLSSSVSDAIRRQVEDKWSLPAGATDAGELAVEIRISLLPDGTVQWARIVDQARLSQAFYRAMAESARRAVQQASPLRGLPPEKYEQWREITFTFKPPV